MIVISIAVLKRGVREKCRVAKREGRKRSSAW